MKNNVLNGIMGLVVGDALGVPVEFMSRQELQQNPVCGMRSFGSHQQPQGTWSDDSSMTLCLAESLLNGLHYEDICNKFLAWAKQGYMTPHGEMFDIGRTTLMALRRYSAGTAPLSCGPCEENDNGNGSLMRILPIAFYVKDKGLSEQFSIIHDVSKLTHGHARSLIACGIYVQLALALIEGCDKMQAYQQAIKICADFYRGQKEIKVYQRILNGKLANLQEKQIRSGGYVVDTLEAAIWSLLTTKQYRDCVLKAVNLGDDTDTVGAVAGGLAGLLYGYDAIPEDWKAVIVNREKIETLCVQLNERYQ